MKKSSARQIALGGVMAALAVSFMCLGGLIPVATYVCPMLCMILLAFVTRLCGMRIGWAWYGVVGLLSALMGPDKEAAAMFLCLGYYPIVKPELDKSRLRILWKLLLFNGATCAMYWVLIRLLGMEQLAAEFTESGRWMLAVMLVLGNLNSLLLDVLLKRLEKKFWKA